MDLSSAFTFHKSDLRLWFYFFLVEACLFASVFDQPRIMDVREERFNNGAYSIITFRIPHSEIIRTNAQLMPAGCLDELKINQTRTSWRMVPPEDRCHDRKGIPLALYVQGKSEIDTVSITLRPDGPVFGLRVRSDFFTPRRIFLFGLGILFLIAFLWEWRERGTDFFYLTPFWTIHTLAVYLLYTLSSHPPRLHVYSDMYFHYGTALKILSHVQGLYESQKPFAYPLLLWFSMRFFKGVAFVSYVHSIGMVVAFLLVAKTVDKLFGKKVAILTTLVLIGHLPFLLLNGLFMAESPFIVILSVIFYRLIFATRFSVAEGLILGFLFGISGWLKGQAILFLPLYFVWLYLKDRSFKKWRYFAATLGGFVICGLLHYAITGPLFGHPTFTPPVGALNLVEGKCPEKHNYDSTGAKWLSPLFSHIGEKEKKYWDHPFTDDAFFWRAGLKCVWEHPSTLITSVRYIYYLFFGNPLWPGESNFLKKLSRAYQILFTAFLIPGLLYGLWLSFRQKNSQKFIPFLFIASLFLCSYLLKAELRYRVPFDIFLIPVSAWGWTEMLGSDRRYKLLAKYEAIWFAFSFCVLWIAVLTF